MNHITLREDQMLMLSSSADFWSRTELAEEDTQLAIVSKDGDTQQIDVNPNFFAGKKVLVLVHGFNNTVDNIINFFFHIKDNLENTEKTLYHFIVGYVWPGYLGRIFYLLARSNAQLANIKFQKSISQFFSKAEHIDVLGNSMGSRVVCEALKVSEFPLIRNFFLWAPAINIDDFEEQGLYSQVNAKCKRMFVYFSHNDTLLRFVYPLGEMSLKPAMGYLGPAYSKEIPDNVHFIDATEIVNDHGTYRLSEKLVQTILKVADQKEHIALNNEGEIITYQKRSIPNIVKDLKTRIALLISFNQISTVIEMILKLHLRALRQ